MGSVISMRTRNRIEAQGFLGLDDVEIAQLNYWFRLSPAVCMVWTAVGVYLESPAALAALIPLALTAGLLKWHPFDVVYNFGLRFISGGPRIPAYGKQRRFGFLMASFFLSVAALGFFVGIPVVGYALGGMMVASASVNMLTGYCVPGFVYGKLFGASAPAREVAAGI